MDPRAAIALLEAINAEAERDMLAGNPVTGAHHRAILRKLEELRQERNRASRRPVEFHSREALAEGEPRPAPLTAALWRDDTENPL